MSYFESLKQIYPRVYPDDLSIVHHLICVIGNGIGLNNKGFLDNSYNEDIIITDPIKPLNNVYPFTRAKYLLKYAGCRNKGFKDAVQYLISCIMITPDHSIRDISEWKENIHLLEKLRDTPPIDYPYSEKETAIVAFLKELENDSKLKDSCKHEDQSSIKDIKLFDVQWSDCPLFVKEEVHHLWRDHKYGNDNFVHKCNLDDELFEAYPKIYLWLKHKGVKKDERILINYWW